MTTSYKLPAVLRQAVQAVAGARGRVQQLRRTFDRSLIPMLIVDNQRRYLEVNAAARLLLRMSQRELRRMRIDDLMPERHRASMRAAWQQLLERGEISERARVTFQDGSTLLICSAAIANALPGRHLIMFVPADWPGDELQKLQPPPETEGSTPLSARQIEVLRLLAAGSSVPQIAEELSISEATVRTHVRNLLLRLGAKNRAHAVALATCYGLRVADEALSLEGAAVRRG